MVACQLRGAGEDYKASFSSSLLLLACAWAQGPWDAVDCQKRGLRLTKDSTEFVQPTFRMAPSTGNRAVLSRTMPLRRKEEEEARRAWSGQP